MENSFVRIGLLEMFMKLVCRLDCATNTTFTQSMENITTTVGGGIGIVSFKNLPTLAITTPRARYQNAFFLSSFNNQAASVPV